MHAVFGGLRPGRPGDHRRRVVIAFYLRPAHRVAASSKPDACEVTGCVGSSGRSRAADQKRATVRASAQSNVMQAILTVIWVLPGVEIAGVQSGRRCVSVYGPPQRCRRRVKTDPVASPEN